MRKTKKEKPNLINAKDRSCFWINNGPVLKNLKDLKESLLIMSKETFNYHVNKEKNDFAAWIKETLKDSTLANKLAKTKTLKPTIKAIEDRLKKYNV
ncbi:MAG: hypothetical protein KAU07_01485 [Candidatus Andersenbacteria bacterium]|nr:hypothetical protein [Candidatus Andersenbacteria bacterium]